MSQEVAVDKPATPRTRRMRGKLPLAAVVLLAGAVVCKVAEEDRRERLDRALYASVEKSDYRAAEALLSQGANPNFVITKRPGTVTEYMRYLMGRRLPLHRNGTVLHAAVWNRDVRMAGLLVRAGANVRARVRDGWTELIFACGRGDVEMVRFLLDSGVDPNVADRNGITPLHVATASVDEALVRLLLEKGADRNRRDAEGETAADYARHIGNSKLAQLLKKRD